MGSAPFFVILSPVIRPQLVKSFTAAALSPDPDLAVAALMIARIEYPALDAGPYLDQLDLIGSEARRRVADAPAFQRSARSPSQRASTGRSTASN